MTGNTKAVDTLVLPEAIQQIVNLKSESAELRTEMTLLLETAVKLNATLGGSTPATFAKNAKASTDATDKLIQNSNKQLEVINKKAAAEEAAYNKYLQLLSKQEAERQKADAKEIAAAEKKAAKLLAIQAETARKAAVQFPTSQTPYSPVTSDDTPAVRYEPIITGEESMRTAVTESTAAFGEQKEVLDSLSTSYRSNIELLLTLQVEQAENAKELRGLNVETAAQGERAVFLTAEQLRLKTAIQQTNLTLSQQTKQMLAEDTSAAQTQSRLDELRVAYNNLSLAEKENVEIGGVWLAEIETLDVAIKEHTASIGVHNNQVGAYEKAIAKATNADQLAATAVNVLTRSIIRMLVQFLLIGVVIEAATWLFDWIKNLDVFTGRLDQATQNLKAFNEVQKNAASDAGGLVGKYRILSDTVKDLTVSYDDRVRAATELKKLFPEELAHSTAQAIANGTESVSLDKLADSVIKLAKAKAAANEIEKTEGEIIALQIQRDKVNSAKSDNLDATNKGQGFGRLSFFERLGRPAGAASSKETLRGIFKSDADKDNADIAAQIKVKEGTIKLLEQYGGLSTESESIESKGTLNPKAAKTKDTANTDLLESQRIEIEIAKNKNKQILDDDQYSYSSRIVALNQYIAKSKELLEKESEILNADGNLRPQQRLNDLKKLKNQELEIDVERLREIDKLNKEELEKHKKLLADTITTDKEAQQEQLEDLNQGAIVAAQVLQNGRDKLINAKNAEYASGKITEKQYSRDLLAINDQYAIDRLSQELVVQQAILAIQEATRDKELEEAKSQGATPVELGKITSDANRGIAGTQNKIGAISGELGNAISKQRVDKTKDPKEAALEKQKEQIYLIEETGKAAESAQALINSGYENQIAKLEQISQGITSNAQIEKDAINTSLDTQENKARRQSVLDAQVASQQRALQQQINKEKEKEAQAEKIANIAKIIQSTALAAIKAPAELGPVLGLAAVPIVLALGAVQLGLAVATKTPQYWKGTNYHPGGDAIVGDKGFELVEEPGRPAFLSQDVATKMNLAKGTKVFTHEQTLAMLPKTPNWVSSRTDNSDVVAAINTNTNEVKRANSQRKANGRVSGWMEEQRKATQWSNYSNNYFR